MLHISNSGPFPLTVRFSFLNGGVALHKVMPYPGAPPPPERPFGEPPEGEGEEAAVSYTHLTLPTNREV